MSDPENTLPPPAPNLAFRLLGNPAPLFEALAKAQGEFPQITKDATNPHFNKKYADLASILDATRKALSSNGLCLFCPMTSEGEGYSLSVTLAHASGAMLVSECWFPQGSDVQKTGSARTYMMRYVISSLLAVAGKEDDDDGNAAVGNQGRRDDRPQQRTQQAPTKAAPAKPAQAVAPKAETPPEPAQASAKTTGTAYERGEVSPDLGSHQDFKADREPGEESDENGPVSPAAKAELWDLCKANGIAPPALAKLAELSGVKGWPGCLGEDGGALACEKVHSYILAQQKGSES